MNAMDNKASYIAAKAAYNARELDRCLAFYSPEHQIMSQPTPPGREHIRAFLEGTLASWPDLRLEIAHVVAEGDLVMGRCVATATHTTTIMGIPPTGKPVVTTFWDLHRFDEAGLIIQTWNLMDGLSLMQQLGSPPAADAAAPAGAARAEDAHSCAVSHAGAGRGSLALSFLGLCLAVRLRRRSARQERQAHAANQ